jgi:hypothetical protein
MAQECFSSPLLRKSLVRRPRVTSSILPSSAPLEALARSSLSVSLFEKSDVDRHRAALALSCPRPRPLFGLDRDRGAHALQYPPSLPPSLPSVWLRSSATLLLPDGRKRGRLPAATDRSLFRPSDRSRICLSPRTNERTNERASERAEGGRADE